MTISSIKLVNMYICTFRQSVKLQQLFPQCCLMLDEIMVSICLWTLPFECISLVNFQILTLFQIAQVMAKQAHQMLKTHFPQVPFDIDSLRHRDCRSEGTGQGLM